MSTKVINLVFESTTTVTGGAVNLSQEDTRTSTYQATVEGTGAVSANVVIEVSNDNKGWLSDSTSTLALSGTTVASKGYTSTASWVYTRARITAVSGTGAKVTVTATVGA